MILIDSYFIEKYFFIMNYLCIFAGLLTSLIPVSITWSNESSVFKVISE